MANFSTKMQPIGGDFGHSNAKIVTHRSTSVIPVGMSEGPILEEVNGVFDPTYSRKSIDNISLNTPWGARYVGNLAKRSQIAPWSIVGKAKYDHPNFMPTLLMAALSECYLSGDPILLVTAVPAEWHNDEALKKTIVQKLRGETGEYTIDRFDKKGNKVAKIANVVVVSETAGLMYSYLLDSNGELSVADYRNLTIMSIDIGKHTTCIDIFRNLARQGKTQTYDDVSMGQIHESVARQVVAKTGRHLHSYEIEDIIIGNPVQVPIQIKNLVIELYTVELDNHRNTFQSIATSAIKDINDIDIILVGGGGSEPLGTSLRDLYPKHGDKIPVCGQLATAQGLYNYGVRLCK